MGCSLRDIPVSEIKNIGLLCVKVRRFLPQKYGTFMQRSPMFLYFQSPLPITTKKSFVKNSHISYIRHGKPQ